MHELSQIYKAKQCTDLNDCDYAIGQTRQMIIKYGEKYKLVQRLFSLKQKRILFEKKEFINDEFKIKGQPSNEKI